MQVEYRPILYQQLICNKENCSFLKGNVAGMCNYYELVIFLVIIIAHASNIVEAEADTIPSLILPKSYPSFK